MFHSGLFDKSSAAPENSSGRNNICNRFPVGITSLGDDNQNIRIQLAVHKYNSSSNNSTYYKHNSISPIRQTISRNSSATKNYECGMDSPLKSENKCGNQYEGVGNFPMVHLEKSSVLYRPIKRFIRKGITYPEIPENRFLNHIPELCSESKPNPRSVLDVLQDLSRKRIHSKAENNYHKKRSQGLGGGSTTNDEVAYKPLFIKKNKTLPVTTKDNTTQTILPYSTDKSNNSFTVSNLVKNDASDPKAELRRKLAKQNNEIFASLSSSIAPTFSIKRKIDKISKGKNESKSEILTSKKPKLFDNQKNNCEANENVALVNGIKTDRKECSPKTNSKNKLKNGVATSPNKDRLTTIFLDMQSENSNAQIFKNTSIYGGTKNLFENNTLNSNKPLAQTSTNMEETGNKQNETAVTKENVSSIQLPTTEPEKIQNSNHLINTSFQFPLSKSNNFTSNDTTSKSDSSSSLHDKFVSSNTLNFNFKTSQNSDETPQSNSLNSSALQNTTVFTLSDKMNKTNDNICVSANETNTGGADKKNILKPFVFENLSESEIKKTELINCKFNLGSNSPVSNISKKDDEKTESTNSTSTVVDNSGKPEAFQFSFNVKSIPTTTSMVSPIPTISTPPLTLNSNKTITNSVSLLEKPTFAFEKSSVQQNLLENFNKLKNETEFSNKNSPVITITTTSENSKTSSSFEKSFFNFGKKSSNEVNTTVKGQSKTENIQNHISSNSQSTNSDCLKEGNSLPFLSTNTTTTTQTCSSSEVTNQNKLFSQVSTLETIKEQNSGIPSLCDSSSQKSPNNIPSSNTQDKPIHNALQEQKQLSSFSFNLVQNCKTQSKENSSEKNNQPIIFSFGQKSKEESCKNILESPNLIQIPDFGQKSSNPMTESNLNSVNFGQNNKTDQGNQGFNQSSNPTKILDAKTMNSFVIKNEAAPFGSVFGQNNNTFSTKTPIFGAANDKALSNATFGISNNQSTAVFGASNTSTSNTEFKPITTSVGFGVSSMVFVSTTANTFGVNTTTQSSNTFGVNTTTQPSNNFGVNTTTQSSITFGGNTTTQPSNTFDASKTTQSTFTFGATTTTTAQSSNSFNTTTTSQTADTFGLPTTNPTNIFGASSNQLTNVFGSNTTKLTNSFGASTTAQSGTGFGLPSSSPFGQSFVQNSMKTSTTSGQPSVNIFGQNTNSSNTISNAAFNLPTNSNFNSSTSNNIFGHKSNNEQGNIFGQLPKAQTSPFRQTPVSQSFNIGMSTSIITGFTTSPPNTTTSSVFTFGASSQAPAFNFGNNLSTNSSNTPSPFAFTSPSNDTFKIGVSNAKENSGFGGNNTSTFTFGAQMNNMSMAIKPTESAFNFGSVQSTTTPAFNFSSHSASPIFSFGGSGSSTSSSSTFNFGTPQSGSSFGQPTPSPVATFSAPGTFSIGSGTSQSRQRASSRLRRRP